MRKIIFILCNTLKAIVGISQDTLVNIRLNQFNEHTQISLAEIKRWLFKQGTNREYSNKKLDTAGWKKIKSVELTVAITNNDASIGTINTMPQHIGGVILNLITNDFMPRLPKL